MPQRRLLVIEDDQHIAQLIGRVAEEMDFNVRKTRDFAEIPTLYDIFTPHIIVLDIVMPEMDGFEVLQFLHQRKSNSRVVIISGQADYRELAARMGDGLGLHMVTTITKPFRLTELRQLFTDIQQALPDESAGVEDVA